ncbi:MAG TPA: tyrosinase family protein [Pyrinomonadaceae bacterium]|nr:tyrosinase family protein [Pyrinomonadaceae bacterium]
MAITRNSAWNNGGTFKNADLLWYAKGVGVMQTRALNDTKSWWFFAAIHGQEISLPQFPGWGHLPAPPAVPTTPLPTVAVRNLYWDQCQHQSWYFPPWHRGYLYALEAHVRAAVVGLGGPKTWALPYWNYFGPKNQYEIPPAFTTAKLPDGSPNPLLVKARYGPLGTGKVYVEIPPASEKCQNNTIYTGSNPATPFPGYGGPQTGFSHFGQTNGNLESNPHNLVHVDVGGNGPNNTYGLMSDPGLAALDPIFYLHHCNIDRMWAAWNAKGNANPTAQNWLKGPPAVGGRKFAMPMPNGTSWVYTPADVNSITQLKYTYESLSTAIVLVHPTQLIAQRLTKLGASPAAEIKAPEASMDMGDKSELVGANQGPVQLKTSGARATVKLDSKAQKKVSSSLAKASAEALPDRAYLQLENVRGNFDANKLDVSVNQQHVGTVALFGLRRASLKDSGHGGEGLTFVIDITDVIDSLFLNGALDANSLDVRIVPSSPVPDSADITIGRVSVYRQAQQ